MTDRTMERTSRRGLLATALGGLAAAAAATLSGPATIRAAGQGQALVLGESNTATGTTSVVTEGTSTGLSARSPSGDGLVGRSGATQKSGVYGRGDNPGSYGVYGYNSSQETRGSLGGPQAGVEGYATTGRAALFSATQGGIALGVSGRIAIGQAAGTATISIGTKTVTVKPNIGPLVNPMVHITPRSPVATLWVTWNQNKQEFTIRTNVTTVSPIQVNWLVIG